VLFGGEGHAEGRCDVVAGGDADFVDEGLQQDLALAVRGLVEGGSELVAGVGELLRGRGREVGVA